MKAKIISFPLIYLFISLALHAQTEIISNNLQVTGSLDVEGNTSSMGTFGSGSTALNQTFTPTTLNGQTIPYRGDVNWDMNLSAADFNWRRLNASGTDWQNGLQLSLTPASGSSIHTLKLYGSDPAVAPLTLGAGSSSASSIIPGNLTVNGNFFLSNSSQNILPYQTLGSTSSILTRTLGDARYHLRSGTTLAPTLVFGIGSSASQAGSIALGSGAVANGGSQTPSIAIGKNVTTTATSDGQGSIAIGWNSQAGGIDRPNAIAIGTNARSTGFWSLAIGYDAESSWWNSVAIGASARATQGYAQAFGCGANATGYCSSTMGMHTVANGFGQTALGVGNAFDPAADMVNMVGTQDLLVVGNGNINVWPPQRSNAFTIKWNGDGWIQGNFTTEKNLNVTQDATVTGKATVLGTLEGSKAKFTDTVRIEPRGGLSMGEFIYDPDAPPSGN
jgi:trimeric autotransporter adhesin